MRVLSSPGMSKMWLTHLLLLIVVLTSVEDLIEVSREHVHNAILDIYYNI